jgi:hypothetical protein
MSFDKEKFLTNFFQFIEFAQTNAVFFAQKNSNGYYYEQHTCKQII